MSLGPVMVGLSGLTLLPEERDMLADPLVGGVILFSRNYESPEQVAQLTTEIKALRSPGLLVAVDQEGGRVQRFRKGFTLLPAVAALGRRYDEDPDQARHLAEVTGWLMAIELRSVGVDFSFAPVLDIGTKISRVIGDRAFHRDPEVIADLARHYVRGMKQAGMAATGKHFPGHGGVTEDSHVELPVDTRSIEDLQVADLLPFERMIHYGIEGVMVAHVIYQAVDDSPAGFSPYWLRRVLRTDLGFQGAIFSDDLEMAAASVAGDFAQRAQRAIAAGCDMVLVCKDPAAVDAVLTGLRGWQDPVAQLRLARMHGTHSVERAVLMRDPRWQQACRAVGDYDEPHTLGLL